MHAGNVLIFTLTKNAVLENMLRLRYVLIGSVVAVSIAVVSLVIAYPAIGAAACPLCFGMERVSSTLIVDREMPAATRQRVIEDLAFAEEAAAGFFGLGTVRFVVLGCSSEVCDRALGGKGARAEVHHTPFISFVRVSPRGLNRTILTHEFVHLVVRRLAGFDATLTGRLPAWFDEGLAVIVSADDRYLKPGATADERCRHEPAESLPASPFEWGPLAGKNNDVYAKAACAVLRWMDANGGHRGLLAAFDRVRRGEVLR